jgi:hypothetical protein
VLSIDQLTSFEVDGPHPEGSYGDHTGLKILVGSICEETIFAREMTLGTHRTAEMEFLIHS